MLCEKINWRTVQYECDYWDISKYGLLVYIQFYYNTLDYSIVPYQI